MKKTLMVGILALIAVLAIATAVAGDSEFYLTPQNSGVSAYCNTTEVQVWINASEPILGGLVKILYTGCCANITTYSSNKTMFEEQMAVTVPGRLSFDFSHWVGVSPTNRPAGVYHIGNFTIHCCNETSNCKTDLLFTNCELYDQTGHKPPFVTTNGTFLCGVPRKPDLVITEKSEDWVNLQDKTYTITYTVCNEGDAYAGKSNTTITIDGIDAKEDAVPELKADKCYTSTVGPLTMSDHSDTINVCADKKGEVEESEEQNNCRENVLAIAPSVFDTGQPENPYPSIMGTHTGEIKPNKTIIVHKMYTYSCTGTGGHTKYVRIYGKGLDVTKTWKGYIDSYHNIAFDPPITLEANTTYNYEIRTGSYPQIFHAQILLMPNGTISCTQFTDAKGNIYYDWIPAIKFVTQ